MAEADRTTAMVNDLMAPAGLKSEPNRVSGGCGGLDANTVRRMFEAGWRKDYAGRDGPPVCRRISGPARTLGWELLPLIRIRGATGDAA